jgi:hypothetical protein
MLREPDLSFAGCDSSLIIVVRADDLDPKEEMTQTERQQLTST